jgi:hypothetical protein
VPMIGDRAIQTSRQMVTTGSAGCSAHVMSRRVAKCVSFVEPALQATPEGRPVSVRFRTSTLGRSSGPRCVTDTT